MTRRTELTLPFTGRHSQEPMHATVLVMPRQPCSRAFAALSTSCLAVGAMLLGMSLQSVWSRQGSLPDTRSGLRDLGTLR